MGDAGKTLQGTSGFPTETDGQPNHSLGVLAITEETVEAGLFGENSLCMWVFELAVVDVSTATVLHALLNDALTAREAERRRIARELQAETAQSLVSLLVALRTVEESHDLGQAAAAVNEVRGLVSAALENVQRLARGLDAGERSSSPRR